MNPKTRTQSLAQTRKCVLSPQHPAVPRGFKATASPAQILAWRQLYDRLLAPPVIPPPAPTDRRAA
jgi:hypothetical protein